jgi:hypothetical protein
MQKKIVCCLGAIAGAMLLTATIGYSFDIFGNNVNDACTPVEPYTGDCLLYHTLAKDADLVGGDTLSDFFCQPTPTCIDLDSDGFAVGGGVDCGPVDSDDTDATINPSAVDTLNNGIDENYDGADSVNLYLLDSDGDGFAPVEGDCNDYDPAINPVVTDIPNNDVDENCDGADSVDPHLLDTDGDSYTPAGGDCNDTDAAINPGTAEVGGNGVDENCNGTGDDYLSNL